MTPIWGLSRGLVIALGLQSFATVLLIVRIEPRCPSLSPSRLVLHHLLFGVRLHLAVNLRMTFLAHQYDVVHVEEQPLHLSLRLGRFEGDDMVAGKARLDITTIDTRLYASSSSTRWYLIDDTLTTILLDDLFLFIIVFFGYQSQCLDDKCLSFFIVDIHIHYYLLLPFYSDRSPRKALQIGERFRVGLRFGFRLLTVWQSVVRFHYHGVHPPSLQVHNQ